MKKKAKYRIRNWRDYNRSLVNRRSLTFWISEDLLTNWIEKEKSGGRGASPRYTKAAMVAMASLKFVFAQAGRQTCGLVASIFRLLKVALPVPDHSTVSRRMAGLEVGLPVKASEKARHLVIDSTGLKVYGEGEWKVRTHGVSKRRTWRKLHLCIDATTGEVLVAAASENSVSDCAMFPEILRAVAEGEEIEQISADGSYDRRKVYDALNDRAIKRAAIPPRRGAKIWQHGNSRKERLIRDENLRAVRKRGRPKWKREANYHRRSLAETGVFRFKQIFTDKLQSRNQDNQFQEMIIKCAAMNRMTHLGMPDSYKIAV
ncbi:MAG: IS5 family transposase [Acidobacteria bacterium]|nr:IS5 family transposase [Acidobacteriota bacterium]